MPAWSAIVRTGEGCAHKLAASSACLIACARERSRLSVGDLHTTPQLRIGAIVHTRRCPSLNIATTCNGMSLRSKDQSCLKSALCKADRAAAWR